MKWAFYVRDSAEFARADTVHAWGVMTVDELA